MTARQRCNCLELEWGGRVYEEIEVIDLFEVIMRNGNRHLDVRAGQAPGNVPQVEFLVEEAAEFIMHRKDHFHNSIRNSAELLLANTSQFGLNAYRHGNY